MILTSAFMYFCNIDAFCPCVVIVSIATKQLPPLYKIIICPSHGGQGLMVALQIRRVCIINSPYLRCKFAVFAASYDANRGSVHGVWRFSRPYFRGGHTGSPLWDASSIKKTSPSLGRSCIMPQRHVSVVYFTITFFPLIMYMPLCMFSLVTRCPLRLYIFSSALSLLSCVMPSMPAGSVLMR